MNKNAGSELKSAVYNIITKNAPKTENGEIDWTKTANIGYLQTAVPEAIAQIESEGIEKWADIDSFAYYWENDEFGKGFGS
jgi:hypothetical protein